MVNLFSWLCTHAGLVSVECLWYTHQLITEPAYAVPDNTLARSASMLLDNATVGPVS